MFRFMSRAGIVLFAGLALACHSRPPLGSATLGDARLSTRTTMPKGLGGTFDEPLLPEETGLVSFTLQPRSTVECIEQLDESRLRATANGAPMKLESAGGSHVEHPMGPSHFPVAQTI